VIDLHGAKVKNPHNKRYIPLHRDLLDLVVLDLVRCSPDRLFPELKYRASAESWSSAISMKLNREIEPPRVCRRPQLLRGWGYDEQDDEQVLA
jgi:hypothetical protein